MFRLDTCSELLERYDHLVNDDGFQIDEITHQYALEPGPPIAIQRHREVQFSEVVLSSIRS